MLYCRLGQCIHRNIHHKIEYHLQIFAEELNEMMGKLDLLMEERIKAAKKINQSINYHFR